MIEIKEPYGFIYITTNMINGKRYIGQKKFQKGINKNSWVEYIGSGKAFKLAVKKYGKENFCRDIVAIDYSKDKLDKLEIEWIKNYNAVESDNFYNIVKGGGTVSGLKHSKETKLKMSKNSSKPNLGKHLSKETKEKIRQSNLGKIHTEEWKKMHSEKMKENPPFLGNHHNAETKQKISETHKGKLTNEDSPHAKKIICLTTNEIFNYINEAQKYYNCNHISSCCIGERSFSGISKNKKPLIWIYYDDYLKMTKEEIEDKLYKGFDNMIYCITTKEMFFNIEEASNKYNINRWAISNCINKRVKLVENLKMELG